MLWASTFSSDSLEREYQAELCAEKIRLTRILAVLAVILNLSFVVLDLWAIPSALTEVWTLRAVIVIALTCAFLSTWLRDFQALYEPIILCVVAIMGGGILAMIYLAQPSDVAANQYFGGLLLVIIGLHTLTYAAPRSTLAMSLTLLLAYTLVAVFAHGYHSGSEGIALVANLFIGVSVTVIGFVAQNLRERYSRENYLLRHSLQHDVKIKDEEKRRASYLAEHDPLTGLANRLRFERQANGMMEFAAREGTWLAVMFIDLDGFKPVNDTHGHAVGDRILKVIAERLRARLRSEDLCARIGGDEFVVAMAVAVGDRRAISSTARRMADAIRLPVDLRGIQLQLSASIGVALFPHDGASLQRILSAADERMYHVKNNGRDAIAMTAACQEDQLAG
jgi:diguanylate cyclase (GGDEF)-like protein